MNKYKVIDFCTNETIIETNDKNSVKSAISEWIQNNPSALIEIHEDGVCIYP